MSNTNERISALERDMVAVQVEMKLQFKEVFNRVKRIEAVIIATSGATIIMLITILTRMG